MGVLHGGSPIRRHSLAKGIMSRQEIENLENLLRQHGEQLARIETKMENLAPISACEKHRAHLSFLWSSIGILGAGVGTLFWRMLSGEWR